jgi:hypothetical protein
MINDLMVATPRKPGGPAWNQLGAFLTSNQLRRGAWADMDRSADLQSLSAIESVLDALDQAALCPVFFKPYVHDGDAFTGERDATKRIMAYSVLLPELQAIRRIALLNAAAMRAAGATGDWAGLEQRLHAGLWLGIGLTRQSTPIEIQNGLANAEVALEELASIINDEAIPPVVVNRLLQIIDDLQWSPEETKLRLITCMDLMVNDIIQWTFTDFGHGNGFFTWDDDFVAMTARTAMRWPTSLRGPSHKLFGLFVRDRHETVRELEVVKSEVAALAHESQGENGYWVYDRMQEWRRSLKSRSFVIEAGLPLPLASFRSVDHFVSRLHGVRAMLLLELAYDESGMWPASLDEVMDEHDLTDPISGRPYWYWRTTEEDSGQPYALEIPWRNAPMDPRARVNPPRGPLMTVMMGNQSSGK